MYLIMSELRKILKNKYTLLLMAALLIINGYNIQVIHNSRDGSRFYRPVSSQLESVSLNEVENRIENNEIYIEDQALSQEIREIIHFSKYYNKQVKDGVEVLISKLKQDAPMSNKYVNYLNYSIGFYEGRSIDHFKYSKGVHSFLDYNFSILVSLIVILFVSTTLYSSEVESKMSNLQKTTVNYERIVLSKSLALLLHCILLATVMLVCDLFMFSRYNYFGDLSLPLYYLSEYAHTPLNLSIAGFILLKSLATVMGLWFASLVFSLVSLVLKKSSLTFVVNTGILLVFLNYIPLNLRSYNPFTNFFMASNVKNFEVFFLFDNPIPLSIFVLLFTLLIVIVLIYTTSLVQRLQRR